MCIIYFPTQKNQNNYYMYNTLCQIQNHSICMNIMMCRKNTRNMNLYGMDIGAAIFVLLLDCHVCDVRYDKVRQSLQNNITNFAIPNLCAISFHCTINFSVDVPHTKFLWFILRTNYDLHVNNQINC